MPYIAKALGGTPFFGFVGTPYLPQKAFGGGNLVGAHHKECIAYIQYRIGKYHLQECILLKESSSKVLQIPNQLVIRLCPVHGKVKIVLFPLDGIGEIAGIGTVGDDKELQILIE